MSTISNLAFHSRSDQTRKLITFAGMSLLLDALGVAYFPECGSLIVSDLHLEKGSRAGSKGHPVPRLDSFDTLSRLRHAIECYSPSRVICLGDSFDDTRAMQRMLAEDRSALVSLCGLVSEWVWVTGNHDPFLPGFCPGVHLSELHIGKVRLGHQPVLSATDQIVGHFHPRAVVGAGRARFSGPCFSVSEHILIMPAFGSFTGGLLCSHPVLEALHTGKPRCYMLYRDKIWQIC